MTDHPGEGHRGGTADSADPPQGLQADSPGAQPGADPPVSRARRPAGIEKRRPGGRERPYRALRVLAKLYAILAPMVLIGLVLVGLASLMRSAPLADRVGSTVGVLLLAGLYYLLMTSISDALYVLFDIAGNTRRIREAVEMRESKPS
jgi:hypothetical protein